MKKIVLYWTLHYPTEEIFYEVLDLIDFYNIDVLEIGIPVERPFMDGEIIRNTHQKVLNKGLCQKDIIQTLEKVKANYEFDVVLMTYEEGVQKYNLLEIDPSLHDGILSVNGDIKNLNNKPIKIYNEETTIQELAENLKVNRSFAYIMTGVGQTGSFDQIPTGYKMTAHVLRNLTNLPLYVGFGIKTPDEIQRVLEDDVDGVIIGSYFIRLFEEEGLHGLNKYLSKLDKLKLSFD